MTYKIIIEATEAVEYNKEVERALSDLNIALGDELITWKEGTNLRFFYKELEA